jgi:hypothetical protein
MATQSCSSCNLENPVKKILSEVIDFIERCTLNRTNPPPTRGIKQNIMRKFDFKSSQSVLSGAGVKKMVTIFVLSMCITSIGYAQDATPAEDGDMTNAEADQTLTAPATLDRAEASLAASWLTEPAFGLQDPASTPAYRRKIPGLAFLFSYLYPGMGQFYNGEKTKGAIMTAAATVGLVSMFAGIATTDEDGYMTDDGAMYVAFGLIVYSVDIIWSMIDAPISSGKINRRNAQALSWNTGQGSALSLQPDFYYATTGIGTKREPVCGVSFKLKF